MSERKFLSGGRSVLAVALLAVALAGPAAADVKAGVDAWAQGDYDRALREWRPLADAGDADAQFNLGQAYKLGRGVPADIAAALEYYRKAAEQGHERAQDNYGLLLFQQNRRPQAMPWLERSAERGEPRAQYLVGTALFNGDLLSRDWVRAYALMTRAAAAGLPQAAGALAHMERYVPEAQRMDGVALAEAMARKGVGETAESPLLTAAPARAPVPVAARIAAPPAGPKPKAAPWRSGRRSRPPLWPGSGTGHGACSLARSAVRIGLRRNGRRLLRESAPSPRFRTRARKRAR